MDKNNSWKAELKNHSGFNRNPVRDYFHPAYDFWLLFGCFLLWNAITTENSESLFKAAISFGIAVFGFILMKIFGKNIKKKYQERITGGESFPLL